MKKKTVSIEEHEKLKEWYSVELKKRDSKIDELEFKNKLLMKTSLKQSEKNLKWSEYAKKLEKNARVKKN